jgi:Ca-activated chloride channel family protein
MDVQKDYYAVLGIDPSATSQEIKVAYRVLARRFHPDANAAPDANERFQELQEAYEILIDEPKRQAYDNLRQKEGLSAPQALVFKATISHRALAMLHEEQILYILVEIAPGATLEIKRLPFNLCLVLDRSTSMQGVRLQRVKDATNFIIDFLDDSDVFSLVTFNDRAEVILPAQSHVDKAFAKSRVSTIRSMGGTEILQGMLAGLNEIERWRSPDMVSHLILLTDGQTYGGERECLEEADAAAQRQINITTMGIGQDWNDKLLDEIARRSGGKSTYIDSASKVTAVFRECIHTLASVVARSMELNVHLPVGVRLQESFLVSPRLERLYSEQGRIKLGNLDAEQPLALVLELLIDPQEAGALHVAQLELQADVPSLPSRHTSIKRNIEARFVNAPQEFEPVPPTIVSALGKLAIFRMQEKAIDDLERGDVEQASQRLETMATRLLNIGENELAKSALLEAGRLARTGHLSPEGRKRIRYGTRSLSMLPKEISHD